MRQTGKKMMNDGIEQDVDLVGRGHEETLRQLRFYQAPH
jgi:hypothetical protein